MNSNNIVSKETYAYPDPRVFSYFEETKAYAVSNLFFFIARFKRN